MIIASLVAGWSLQAGTVFTAPTGLPDEGDVVLEKVVDSVRQAPADTVKAIGGTAAFVADELRNTAHGAVAAFQDATPREMVSGEMVRKVDEAWNGSSEILMHSYDVNEKMNKEILQDAGSDAAVLDVRSFFMGINFPKGTSAYYRPDFKRLVVHQTSSNLLAIDQLMGRFSKEPDYRQVAIETKFIEVEQKTLNELGFNWDFKDSWKMSDNWTADMAGQTLNNTLRSAANALPGATSAGTLTLTKDGWMPLDLAIRALEQSSGANLLSSPSLTTQDGTPAEIWVGDREMMPTQFSNGSKGTSVFADYAGWEQKNIGVHLKVTPTVLENNLINLALNPEVLDLVGYDTYGITPGNASMLMWAGWPSSYAGQSGRYPIPDFSGVAGSAWNLFSATLGGKDPNLQNTTTAYNYDLAGNNDPGGNVIGTSARDYTSVTTDNVGYGYYDTRRAQTYEEFGIAVPQVTGSLPIFRIRKIESGMTVVDGSTVGMGGLIYDKLETYKDKVPVLGSIPLIGRLFRSEGERSIKRNLMIFVTATRVDVNGRRALDMATR